MESAVLTTLDQALIYLRAGISILPIALTGMKSPAWELFPLTPDDKGVLKHRWKPYQTMAVDEETARSWWGGENPPGIAMIGGAVSGNREAIDFDRDAEKIHTSWLFFVESEHPFLHDRLTMHRTPRGFHLIFRCPDVETPTNHKLAILSAIEEPDERKRTLIETRGEAGYILIPGCPPECHPDRSVYTHIGGPSLCDLGTINFEERECLIRCARAFDRSEAEAVRPVAVPGDDLRPGDDFDLHGWTWDELLQGAGWTRFAGDVYWTRPGKSKGVSASAGYCKRSRDGAELFKVFTSAGHPFEMGKAYSKFQVFTLLNAGGDFKRAASMLRGQGFGGRTVFHPPGTNGRLPSAPAAPTTANEPVNPDDPHMGDGLTETAGAGPWKLLVENSDPVRYWLNSPIWQDSPLLTERKGFVLLSGKDLCSWASLRKIAMEQAGVYVKLDSRTEPTWDGRGGPQLLRRLHQSAERIDAPINFHQILCAAEFILQCARKAKILTRETRSKLLKTTVARFEDGSVVFRPRDVAAVAQKRAPGILYDQIRSAAERYGSEFWPRDDEGKCIGRYHRFTKAQVEYIQQLLSRQAPVEDFEDSS
jgi:hypothetical protein